MVSTLKLAVQVDLVDLLTRRTREGVTADRELHEAQAALEGVRASIPPLRAGLDAERRYDPTILARRTEAYYRRVIESWIHSGRKGRSR